MGVHVIRPFQITAAAKFSFDTACANTITAHPAALPNATTVNVIIKAVTSIQVINRWSTRNGSLRACFS